jgi:hypothetical protein
MHNHEEVATGNFVLQAPHSLELNQHGLWNRLLMPC